MDEMLYENAEKRQARLRRKSLKAYRKYQRKQNKSFARQVIDGLYAMDAAMTKARSKYQPSADRAKKKYEKYGTKSGLIKASTGNAWMVDKDFDKELQKIDAEENELMGKRYGLSKVPAGPSSEPSKKSKKKRKTKTTDKKPLEEGLNMNEYELLQLLEECGYEPSDKNLEILKEGLVNGKYEIISDNKVLDESNYNGSESDEMAINTLINTETPNTSYAQRAGINTHIENGEEVINKNKKGLLRKYRKMVRKTHPELSTNVTKPTSASDDIDKEVTAENVKSDTTGKYSNKTKATIGEATKILYVPDYINLSEGLTEYQLMQILDENGCTTTDEDVNLLVEAINNGDVILEKLLLGKNATYVKKENEDDIIMDTDTRHIVKATDRKAKKSLKKKGYKRVWTEKGLEKVKGVYKKIGRDYVEDTYGNGKTTRHDGATFDGDPEEVAGYATESIPEPKDKKPEEDKK